MNRLLAIIRNKYLIATSVFVVWMLFFDRHDLTTQYDYYNQLKALEAEKAYYEAEISRVEKGVEDLQGNAKEIERIAREKYQMKKSGEDVYIILEEK